MRILILILTISLNLKAKAQDSSQTQIDYKVFADVFYTYDFNQPIINQRQDFFFNHNRHNEFNINLALAHVKIKNSIYRANLGVIAGTYSIDNYAAEPAGLQNIFEANIGISLDKKKKWWLDMGVLPSHIGFESAISTENLTLTRSICAENSPYFNSGGKLSYHPNQKWEIALLALNGWQRIQRVTGNSLMSFGSQASYKPHDKLSFNWSTFVGTDDPDSARKMRFFSNHYLQLSPKKKTQFIMGFDVGAQQDSTGSSQLNYWFTPVVIAQHSLKENFKLGLRAEYYSDKNSVIIPLANNKAFNAWSGSVNVDYQLHKFTLFRIEGRYMQNSTAYFQKGNSWTKNNFTLLASFAFTIES